MRSAAVALAFCAALEPVSAVALSCAPWSPVQAFEAAQASASRYGLVVGSFGFAGTLPKAEMVVPAVLTGRALSRTGFDAPWSEPVRLEIGCAAGWCGSVLLGEPYLVFVEHKGDGFAVDLGPCPSVVFSNPTKAVEREMARCLGAGRCDTN